MYSQKIKGFCVKTMSQLLLQEADMRKGYNGKLLFMDLAKQEMIVEYPDENFYRKYIGHGIMGAYFLLTRTKKNIDAFSKDNLLMFMSSVVSGHEYAGLARYTVCGKSPVTGGIGESRSEGPFALALKKTGYDGLVLTGKCKKPSILYIENGVAKLKSAEKLWGKTVSQAMKLLVEEFGEDMNAAVIGPAGENKVRFANIISDWCHQASRSGMGAVMGSKNLKAVVIKGGVLPDVEDTTALQAYQQWFENKMKENVLSSWQHDFPGFAVWIHTHGIDASVCVNNYQSADCDYLENFEPEKFKPYYRGVAKCPGCPNDCIKMYAEDEEKSACGGIHQEIAGALGPNVGNSSASRVVNLNILCNDLGLDPNSFGYVTSFAQECVQREIWQAEGVNLSFTDDAELEMLADKIAYRKDIGDTLAEGSSRAAKILGKEAEKYALTVKRNEMTPIEPRSQTNLAIGFATAAVGPRYEICEHDWDFDTRVGWSHTLDYCRTLGIRERVPMEYLGEKKVHNYKVLSNLWSAADGLGICLFSTAPTRVLSLEDMSALLHNLTGWQTSSYEIMRIGELKQHIYRLYNVREGLKAKDDVLPARFFEEEINFGMHKGIKLSKRIFEQCIKVYYQMMGWDEAGVPTRGTQYDFGLEDLTREGQGYGEFAGDEKYF